jgi:hypothetical protein
MAAQSCNDTSSSDRDDLPRLTVCGSGFFRNVAIQASLLIAVELKTQLQEEESLGPVSLRLDLLSVLDDAKAWSLQCIEAGETNIKGYLLLCLIAAQIEGLMRGIGKDEFPELLVKAAEEAEERCLPILEEKATQSQTEGTVDDLNQMSLNILSEPIEDWDFMVSQELPSPTCLSLTIYIRCQTHSSISVTQSQ